MKIIFTTLKQVIDKLKDFISSSLTNEEKLAEIHSYFTRITEVLLTDNKPDNDRVLDRVLSLDRRMDRWDKDETKIENMNKLIEDVTRINTEVSRKFYRQNLQSNKEIMDVYKKFWIPCPGYPVLMGAPLIKTSDLVNCMYGR